MGLKIAIGGKGGVGKTSVCAVWAQLFAEDSFEILAVDVDPNTSLCAAFGISAEKIPEPLIKMKELIAERTGTDKDAVGAYFRLNPKVSDLPDKHCLEFNGVKLLVLGGITHGGAGCACPEGAFLKALLTHTILQRNEVVLVDLAAGPEFLGRASIQGIDALVVVVEPGTRSIQTALSIANMAKELGVKNIVAIINKITDTNQVETIKAKLKGMTILTELAYSDKVQQADLNSENVFDSDPELVNSLRKAKDELTNLILSGVNSQ